MVIKITTIITIVLTAVRENYRVPREGGVPDLHRSITEDPTN